MSWIGGCVVINDTSKKEIENAVNRITERIRHEVDLEEFPNMRCRNQIIVKDKQIFNSLRSESVIKTICSYDSRIAELEERLREEVSKQKLPVRYAVFYCEYVG